MSPTRRVLYLTPSVRMLGARQSLLQLVRGLDRDRHDPVVACPWPGELSEALAREGVAVEFVPMRSWRKGRSWPFIPWTVARLRGIVRRRGIDLLHCNEIYPTPYAALAAMGRPVATHVRLERNPGMARKYWLGRADRLLCVSEGVRRSLFEGPGRADPRLSPERAEVVYNGLDLEEFAGRVADREAIRSAIREELGLEPGADRFVLGQFGLLSERKRHGDVLRALAAWRDADPPAAARVVYFVLGDEGPKDPAFGASLKKSARELGLRVAESPEAARSLQREAASLGGAAAAPLAVFLPFRSDVAPCYSALDALVLPSGLEGFGRALIEAAAFGVPSLGSRVGGIPEVIAEGETGWLFDAGDTGALLACLREAAGDSAERARRGALALARARERFSLKVHAERVQAIYDELLAESADRRGAKDEG